ncbi:MAG: hypothetical protein ACLVBP_15460 [Ruminococcus sp.]
MGLASAETTATGATVSLSSALSGLMSTLLANPLILIAASVTAAVSAFSAYKRSIEEAVDKAQEAGNAWEDNNTSLQSNIDKITELRTGAGITVHFLKRKLIPGLSLICWKSKTH